MPSQTGSTSRLFFIGFIVAVVAHSHANKEEAKMKMIPVSDSIYAIEGEGANLGACIGDDGILLVDTGFKKDLPGLRRALAAAKNAPVRIVVNTHYHPDHVEANEDFADSAVIIAHENAAQILSRSVKTYDGLFEFKPLPARGLPTIRFKDEIQLHFNGEEIRLRYLPRGHTDNDVIVNFMTSKVVHLGDIFRHQRLPYLEVSGGGTLQGLMKNLELLLQEIPEDMKIIPGHGPLASKEEFREYCRRFFDAVEYVRGQIQRGKSLAQARKEGLPAFYNSYPPSSVEQDMWIEIVYRSLKGEL